MQDFVRRNAVSKLERLKRKIIHGLIVRYLIKCGGAFHHGEYGENGIYIKLFTDDEYGKYQKDLINRRA